MSAIEIDDFGHLNLVGEGGFGAVYYARNMITDEHVAIKIMKPDTSGRF